MKTIDQIIAEKLGSFYIGEWPIGNFILCVIALVLSVFLCGAIGFEREKKGRAAGFRTHVLVGVGSCIIMIISIYGFPTIVENGQTFNRDVARLAAQVIAGVGFLGAGAIMHRNDGIRGLTTAATIWIVMTIGLACGSMNFILAIGGTIIILIFLTFFKKIEEKISNKSPILILHSEPDKPIIDKIIEVTKLNDFEVGEIRTETDKEGKLEYTFRVTANSKEFSTSILISELEKIDGVIDVGLFK